MFVKKRHGIQISSAFIAALALVSWSALPTMAASSTGAKSCSSIVRINSSTSGAIGTLTHSWTAGGGGSPGFRQWYTAGIRNNLTNGYATNWTVLTNGGSINSASATCSGIA